MRSSFLAKHLFSILLATTFLSAQAALAAKSRVFVSGRGADNAACGAISSPCREISFVLNSGLVSPRGEIAILDSAGFGPFVVRQAVAIINGGTGVASVEEPTAGKTAVLVSAGASDRVILRGLDIGGAGTGQTGIAFTSGASLSIEKCVVHDFAVSGIGLGPRASANIVVSHTVTENNGGHGLYVQPSASAAINVVVTLRDVEAYGNGGNGVGIYGNFVTPFAKVRAVAVNSTASGNKEAGFFALGASNEGVRLGPTSNTELVLIRSSAQGNEWGAKVDRHALIYVSESAMFHNSRWNWQAVRSPGTGDAAILTYGDNTANYLMDGATLPVDNH
jgi:hypothetical protein